MPARTRQTPSKAVVEPPTTSEVEKPAAEDDGGDYVRPFERGDTRIFKILVGAGVMEGLAAANKMVLWNPFTLAILCAVGLVVNQFAGFTRVEGWKITALAPLIGIALVGLPFLGGVEYLQRWPFTARMRSTVGAVDIVDCERYYDGKLGRIMVFEHNKEVSGVLALDMRNPGKAMSSILGADEGDVAAPDSVELLTPRESDKKSKSKIKAKANETNSEMELAEIRHLSVDAGVRRFGIGTELVATALDYAFSVATVKRVIVLTSPFTPGKNRIWDKTGFKPVPRENGWRESEPLGLFNWTGVWMAVDRESWEEKRAIIFGGKKE